MILKHIDFEPPTWGELASGPAGSGGGAALTQDADAAFPDRGDTGALLTLTIGAGEHYVAHDLGAEQATLFVRVMLNVSGLANGSVTLLRGLDSGAVETLHAAYDATTGVLTVTLATTDTLTATLVSGLAWHCVEIELDADASGNARLHVNGIEVDSASGDFSSLPTQAVRIGCNSKDTATTGDLYLDEWVMSTTYVGPVVVEPTGSYASDPARWAITYNTAVADSVTWVESYRAARSVPYANLIGLSLGTGDLIGGGAFATMRSTIKSYLQDNALTAQICGLCVGYGVPGRVYLSGAVASMLADLDSDTAAANDNYLSGVVDTDDLPTRESLISAPPYLVADMNAPSLADAQALTTRANALTTTDAAGREFSALDPATDMLGMVAPAWADLVAWLAEVESEQLRLPSDTDFDGSDHGNAIELTDATGGTFNIAGQTKAALMTSGDHGAREVRP